MRIACTVRAGGLNCCAPREGRLDLSDGSLQLDVSAESEAVGTIFSPEYHEIIPAGNSRMQTRGGVPQLMSRLDRAFVNAPVHELLSGGARAECVPVLSRDFPSDHAPLELVILPTRTRRHRMVPRWAPSHPVFEQLLGEAASAIASGPGSSSGAIADITHVAYAIVREVRLSRTPFGASVFAWEAHWVTEARAAWGSGNDMRLSDASTTFRRTRRYSLTPTVWSTTKLVAARVRSLHRSQLLEGFAAELSTARDDGERHATRKKFSRPLEPRGEAHHRITSFGILVHDGSTAADIYGAASALAAHWVPVFDAGGDITDAAAQRFLAQCTSSPRAAAVRPLDFDGTPQARLGVGFCTRPMWT